jgi:hypothetical protein
MLLDDVLALAKGLNLTVSPAVLPIEDMIASVKKAISMLPLDTVGEVQ